MKRETGKGRRDRNVINSKKKREMKEEEKGAERIEGKPEGERS